MRARLSESALAAIERRVEARSIRIGVVFDKIADCKTLREARAWIAELRDIANVGNESENSTLLAEVDALTEERDAAVRALADWRCDHDCAFREENEALTAERDRLAERIDAAAKELPTSWLDPLLTGSEKIDGMETWDCRTVERLLLAIRARVLRALGRGTEDNHAV